MNKLEKRNLNLNKPIKNFNKANNIQQALNQHCERSGHYTKACKYNKPSAKYNEKKKSKNNNKQLYHPSTSYSSSFPFMPGDKSENIQKDSDNNLITLHSGATNHIINDESFFATYEKLIPMNIFVAKNNVYFCNKERNT